jgi:ATP:ADP antiporter, AAA family
MLNFFSYIFDIRRNEWPRLIILYVMGLLFLIGITWGETIVEASFLSKQGVGILPYIFMVDALFTILAVTVYALFVDRISHSKLLLGLMMTGFVGIMLGRLLISSPDLVIGYPYLYIASRIVKELFVLHWWTYVNSFYDTQSAKRVVPFVATGARVAGVVAGLSIPFLNTFLAPENIVILWAITLLMVMFGALAMPRLIKEEARPEPVRKAKTDDRRGLGGYVANLQEGFSYVTQSPYLRWMAFATLLLMIFIPLITYQTSQILTTQLRSTQEISSFLGNLTGITNLIMFPVQLFLLGRIINRLGLGNTHMIYPFGTMVTVGAFLLAPFSLLSAGLAYFYRTTFRTAFRMTIDNLLYNAVPLRVKGRARAFISGFLVPIGSLLGGLILLLNPARFPWLLPTALVILGSVYLIACWFVRRYYAKALVTMLEQEDYSFVLEPPGDLTINNTATLERLGKKAEESQSAEFTIFVAKLMSEVGGKASIPMLVKMAREGGPQTRAAITNILVAADFRGNEVRSFLTDLLHDPAGMVRQSAVMGLRQISDQTSEELYTLAVELLRDPDMDVRLQVIPILIRSGDMFYIALAMQALAPVIGHEEPTWRAAGVRMLAQFKDPRFIQSLMQYLNDADDEVRLEAVTSIESLSARPLPSKISQQLLIQTGALLNDPVERIRQAALTILGNLKTPAAETILISFLTDASPSVRETAAEALAKVASTNTLLTIANMENSKPVLRKMVTVVLCKIDPDKHAEMLRGYIRNTIIAIYANRVYAYLLITCAAKFKGVAVLRNMLLERNEVLLADVFYMLSAIHRAKDVEVIADALESDSPVVKANALEALETLLGSALTKMAAPLFDSENTQMIQRTRDLGNVKAQNANEVLRLLANDVDDPWTRAVAIYAMGEIGAAAFPPLPNQDTPEITSASALPEPQASPKPSEPPKDRRARRGAADLFGALEGKTPEAKPEEKTIPEPIKTTSSLEITSNKKVPVAQPTTSYDPCLRLFTKGEIDVIVGVALPDPDNEVRLAARAARRMMSGIGRSALDEALGKE